MNNQPSGDDCLPALRDDLEIVPGAAQINGEPSWVIFDRVAATHYEIGPQVHRIIDHWHAGSTQALIERVEAGSGEKLRLQDIEATLAFLSNNHLLRDIATSSFAELAERGRSRKSSLLTTALHSYLFFRIPLFRPDRFLQVTWPLVRPVFSTVAVGVFFLLGYLGLYFASRQWDHFVGTFEYLISWQGLLLYAASLVAVKSLHELGHAYMAVRYGLRVPTIGVAFLVLMPVLYTDTSGAWRLRSRCDRLMIDCSGIFVELALAATATLLWAFMPDGPARLCVFAIATTSWATSLAVNLNPFMKFDGYYILSDALGFQNLQERGFAMARWRLREALFGLGKPAPEVLSVRLRRFIILHAWATWIYRFFLFLGIALLVYSFFVKAIGVLLFIVEIVWFILMPVVRELREWWQMREDIMSSNRFLVTCGAIAALVLLAVVPWSTSIRAPAIMSAAQEQRIFAPSPARIIEVSMADGTNVRAGDVLLKLHAPHLELDHAMAMQRAALLKSRIDRAGADAQDRASLIVLSNELKQVREELDGLNRLRQSLTVRAPFDGIVSDIDPDLQSDAWIGETMPLALVRSQRGAKITAYVDERNLFRFGEGASVRFIPDETEARHVDAAVETIAVAASATLQSAYLASRYGGAIAVETQQKDTLRPTTANYQLQIRPLDEEESPQRALRGVSVIEGEAESLFNRAKRQILRVFVREMGV
ncbi:MAG: HlyD family efflux transporter periplasmic adaptor subunit [Ahrensia sp.]|nr:HlyD family efflux transporter periplasmic adaptor subunit [Ahrensia sp.]